MKYNLSGLSPLWLISLAMALGTLIVTLLPVAIASGDTIKTSDWIGFAGNVVSGAMTLFAAAIAWHAVRQQIAAAIEMAEMPENEAWEIIGQDLALLCAGVNAYWKSIDLASQPASNKELAEWRFGTILEYYHELPSQADINRLETAGQSLGPRRRRHVASLVHILRELMRRAEHFESGPPKGYHDALRWRDGRLPSLRFLLTIFATEVNRLDSVLAEGFKGRHHVETNTQAHRERLDQSWRETLDSEEWVKRRSAQGERS
ncbi:hypothetical protein ABIA85_009900 [Bradyrhizobium sp. LA6.10]|uniref:hypothetical protein n=1 Tax=Bradyrhizobium sp. LA6.10 TaxID=3156318 RepID=UPI003392C271